MSGETEPASHTEIRILPEGGSDADTAALLLFYSAECALKAAYLDRHQLANTGDSNAHAKAARSFNHNLAQLVQSLNIPASMVGKPPDVVLQKTRNPVHHQQLHEAWRYGEKVLEMNTIVAWLRSIINWARHIA